LRTLTEEPHVAGTPALTTRLTVDVTMKLLKLGMVRRVDAEYEVLLNYPVREFGRAGVVRPTANRSR
jgi:hypothetical protein